MRLNFLILVLVSAPCLAAVYSHPDGRFAFEIDEAKWEVVPVTSPKPQDKDVDRSMAQKTLVNVQRKQPDERYHARFSVVLDDTKKLGLDAYKAHALEFLKGQRFHVTSTQPRKLAGREAVEIVANQRDFGLTFRQVIFVHDGSAYLLTGATRTKQFEEQNKELDRIFDSFRFQEPAKVSR